jgi:hypothetical protein
LFLTLPKYLVRCEIFGNDHGIGSVRVAQTA